MSTLRCTVPLLTMPVDSLGHGLKPSAWVVDALTDGSSCALACFTSSAAESFESDFFFSEILFAMA